MGCRWLVIIDVSGLDQPGGGTWHPLIAHASEPGTPSLPAPTKTVYPSNGLTQTINQANALGIPVIQDANQAATTTQEVQNDYNQQKQAATDTIQQYQTALNNKTAMDQVLQARESELNAAIERARAAGITVTTVDQTTNIADYSNTSDVQQTQQNILDEYTQAIRNLNNAIQNQESYNASGQSLPYTSPSAGYSPTVLNRFQKLQLGKPIGVVFDGQLYNADETQNIFIHLRDRSWRPTSRPISIPAGLSLAGLFNGTQLREPKAEMNIPSSSGYTLTPATLQGSLHLDSRYAHNVIFNTAADAQKGVTVTYTNLENSSYQGRPIKAAKYTYQFYRDQHEDGYPDPAPWRGNYNLVLYSDPTDGFWYFGSRDSSVIVTVKYYYDDAATQPVNLDSSHAFMTITSLNSLSAPYRVEAARPVDIEKNSDGTITTLTPTNTGYTLTVEEPDGSNAKSSIEVNQGGWLFSPRNNETWPLSRMFGGTIWDSKGPGEYWGSAIARLSGQEPAIEFRVFYSTKPWATLSTQIPHMMTFKNSVSGLKIYKTNDVATPRAIHYHLLTLPSNVPVPTPTPNPTPEPTPTPTPNPTPEPTVPQATAVTPAARKQPAAAQQLPQTGAHQSLAVIALGAMAGLLGFGLAKDQKRNH